MQIPNVAVTTFARAKRKPERRGKGTDDSRTNEEKQQQSAKLKNGKKWEGFNSTKFVSFLPSPVLRL